MARSKSPDCQDCTHCADKVARITGQRCACFPLCPAGEETLRELEKMPRRGVQRAVLSDHQLLAAADPQDLAAAGYFG